MRSPPALRVTCIGRAVRPPVAILSPPRLVVVVAWVPTAQVASLRLWVTPRTGKPRPHRGFFFGPETRDGVQLLGRRLCRARSPRRRESPAPAGGGRSVWGGIES